MESDNIAARLKAINASLAPIVDSLEEDLSKLSVSREPVSKRYIKLLNITERVMEKINPHTPCAQQCSHCCYMSVAISEHEAKLISEYTNLPFVPQPLLKGDEILSTQDRLYRTYTYIPCTFLKQGKCSIYSVRPHACRIHHTIADDSVCCDLKNMQDTPAANVPELSKAFVELSYKWPIGEIREFFPKSE